LTAIAGAAPPDNDARALTRSQARTLKPGDPHYTAYVGPPDLYDLMGASQFRLLCTLGLRDTHKLLDFGCGSLRVGRLLLPYLQPGNYHGIEPNAWLVQDAIANEIGNDQIRIKQPKFSHNADFATDVFGTKFDFILAQSIISHTGRQLTAQLLRNFTASLTDIGIALATFVHVGSMGLAEETQAEGWIYPECVAFHPDTVLATIRAAGLHGTWLPWHHPSQQWYAMAKSSKILPPKAKLAHLSGAVLNTPEFAAST
jgi:cyclopropane fatty-acyl-phospholipid synthase-like methyltransferase